jgi:hypothetical protein
MSSILTDWRWNLRSLVLRLVGKKLKLQRHGLESQGSESRHNTMNPKIHLWSQHSSDWDIAHLGMEIAAGWSPLGAEPVRRNFPIEAR